MDTATLDVILLHFTRLRTVKFSHCPRLDGLAMGLMAKLNGNTVSYLSYIHALMYMIASTVHIRGREDTP